MLKTGGRCDFGSTLDTCVVLGASSVLSSSSSPFSPKSSNPDLNPSFQDACGRDDSGTILESFYTNGSLKLRVVWTISSLIAASARRYLLQQIITDHEMLESLDLTDADGQGVLTMNKGQLHELRMKPVSPFTIRILSISNVKFVVANNAFPRRQIATKKSIVVKNKKIISNGIFSF